MFIIWQKMCQTLNHNRLKWDRDLFDCAAQNGDGYETEMKGREMCITYILGLRFGR